VLTRTLLTLLLPRVPDFHPIQPFGLLQRNVKKNGGVTMGERTTRDPGGVSPHGLVHLGMVLIRDGSERAHQGVIRAPSRCLDERGLQDQDRSCCHWSVPLPLVEDRGSVAIWLVGGWCGSRRALAASDAIAPRCPA